MILGVPILEAFYVRVTHLSSFLDFRDGLMVRWSWINFQFLGVLLISRARALVPLAVGVGGG